MRRGPELFRASGNPGEARPIAMKSLGIALARGAASEVLGPRAKSAEMGAQSVSRLPPFVPATKRRALTNAAADKAVFVGTATA